MPSSGPWHLHASLGFRVRFMSGQELGRAVLPGVEEQHVNFKGEQGYGISAVREFDIKSPCCFQ